MSHGVQDGAGRSEERGWGERIERARELYLLTQTQAYLEIRSVGGEPDAVLVAAAEEFCRVYGELMRAFALTRHVPRQDLDDFVDTIWVKVFAKLPRFHYDPNRPGLRAWFMTLLRNEATDRFRQATRHAAQNVDETVGTHAEPADTDGDPALECERQWDLALVRTLVAELARHVPAKAYRVFCLRCLEELSVSDVAAQLGTSSREVAWRLNRAQIQFRILFRVFAGEQFDIATPREAARFTRRLTAPLRRPCTPRRPSHQVAIA